MRKADRPRILSFDIETSPNLVYTWGLYDQTVGLPQIVQDGYILCWAAKWLGRKEIMYDAIINYPEYFAEKPHCDLKIMETLHRQLKLADIVVAHNGDSFDVKWVKGSFVFHKLPPIPKFHQIDTLKEVKKIGRFTSNKLDFLVQKMSLGAKVKHEGFDLWTKCMAGEPKAWRKMLKYCKQDVVILEKLYLRLRPYMRTHPAVGMYSLQSMACISCGSTRVTKEGFAYTLTSTFQQYSCKVCGRWMKGGKNLFGSKLKGE